MNAQAEREALSPEAKIAALRSMFAAWCWTDRLDVEIASWWGLDPATVTTLRKAWAPRDPVTPDAVRIAIEALRRGLRRERRARRLAAELVADDEVR